MALWNGRNNDLTADEALASNQSSWYFRDQALDAGNYWMLSHNHPETILHLPPWCFIKLWHLHRSIKPIVHLLGNQDCQIKIHNYAKPLCGWQVPRTVRHVSGTAKDRKTISDHLLRVLSLLDTFSWSLVPSMYMYSSLVPTSEECILGLAGMEFHSGYLRLAKRLGFKHCD